MSKKKRKGGRRPLVGAKTTSLILASAQLRWLKRVAAEATSASRSQKKGAVSAGQLIRAFVAFSEAARAVGVEPWDFLDREKVNVMLLKLKRPLPNRD